MIQSIDRAITILNTVAACDSWVGVREVARIVGLKVPTVQNILKSLASHGYLEFSEAYRGYRLGVAPLLLAEKTNPVARMADFARPYLKTLFEQFGETTTCCTLFGGHVVVVDSILSAEPLTVIHPNRIVEHPHCLASGRLLLAFANEQLIQNYIKITPFSELGANLPMTGREFLQELEVIHKQRYAEALNARSQGVGAVAVPVFGPGGDVAFALACSAPLARFDAERRAAVRAVYEVCAQKMGERLGAPAKRQS
jgi:DNA-binding IclR family transcriptional regulator